MINSVHKAMKILTILADENRKPVSLALLSEKAGINKSTCSHIITTLTADGFAERVSHTKGYILGPEAYYLTRFGKYDDELVSVCRPIMKWLHRKTGYAIVLAVIQNQKKFIIESLDDEHRIFSKDEEIRIDDIYRTATGRAILANMRHDEVKSIYDKYGKPSEKDWKGISSYEALVKELSKIGKRSIVSTVSETENEDIISLGYAGAIFKNSACVGAVGVALKLKPMEHNIFKENENDIIMLLKKGIAEINRRLSYN